MTHHHLSSPIMGLLLLSTLAGITGCASSYRTGTTDFGSVSTTDAQSWARMDAHSATTGLFSGHITQSASIKGHLLHVIEPDSATGRLVERWEWAQDEGRTAQNDAISEHRTQSTQTDTTAQVTVDTLKSRETYVSSVFAAIGNHSAPSSMLIGTSNSIDGNAITLGGRSIVAKLLLSALAGIAVAVALVFFLTWIERRTRK